MDASPVWVNSSQFRDVCGHYPRLSCSNPINHPNLGQMLSRNISARGARETRAPKWYKWSVANPAEARDDGAEISGSGSLIRSDALASRQRILAAASALVGDRRVTMTELAAAAKVGRSTLYRHFPTRQSLEQALAELEPRDIATRARQPVDGSVTTMPFRAPGQLG